MQIFIKNPDDKTFTLEVESGHTIEKVKTQIEEREGIPLD